MTQIQTKFKQTEIGLIPEDWEVIELNNVLESLIDYRGKTPKKTTNGIPLVTAKIIKGGKINYSNLEYISEDDYEGWMTRGIPQKGDLVLTTEAPLGEVAQLSDEKIALAQRVITLRGKKNILDTAFLKYFYISDIGKNSLISRESGSVVTGIKQSELRKSNVLIPPLSEQKAIAEILSSLDDKIELLEKQNKTLENIGQALFKSCFVDFEGFQNDLVESEMGMIPRGWKVGKLGEVVENFDSQRKPVASMERSKIQGIYPYYGATSIMDYVNDYLFDGTYVLLGEDGSVMKDNGKPFTQYVYGKIWVNNHAHVLQGKNGFSTELIKIILDNTDIGPFVTGAVQPKVNQGNMNNIPVMIPDKIVLDKLNNLIVPLFEKIKENNLQIQTLSNLRDSLLPRLMSGKIRTKI